MSSRSAWLVVLPVMVSDVLACQCQEKGASDCVGFVANYLVEFLWMVWKSHAKQTSFSCPLSDPGVPSKSDTRITHVDNRIYAKTSSAPEQDYRTHILTSITISHLLFITLIKIFKYKFSSQIYIFFTLYFIFVNRYRFRALKQGKFCRHLLIKMITLPSKLCFTLKDNIIMDLIPFKKHF